MRFVETHQHGSFWIEGDEGHIHADDECLGFTGCFVNVAAGHVYAGPHVFCAHGVRLLTTSHDYTKFGRERIESTYTGRNCDIVLDEGVWVCDSAIIVGPCMIGAHAVIAAGAVVTGNVPPYALMRGNPAVQTKDVRWPDDPWPRV